MPAQARGRSAPAPMTSRCSGHSRRSNTVSLVRCGIPPRPGIGGRAGDRAGGDHEPPRHHLDVTDHHGAAILEASGALDHAHAEAGEALLGIVRRDRRDDAMDVIMNLAEIDAQLLRVDAEVAAAAHGFGALGGGDERLRRHAAGIEALAAHLAASRSAPPARRRQRPPRRPRARRSRRRSRRCRASEARA